MEEARASWNTVYLDTHGFECQVTLRDEDEEALAARVAAITERIRAAGGAPVRRGRNGMSHPANGGAVSGNGASDPPEKTYLDPKGLRRCNLPLRDGKRCDRPVTEKDGRYGRFWSCPNYREHAPPSK